MQAVQNGGYLNPNRSVQISEGLEASAKRFYYYEEWGLPEGAQDQLNQGDVTILLPGDTALRARRMLGRLAWPLLITSTQELVSACCEGEICFQTLQKILSFYLCSSDNLVVGSSPPRGLPAKALHVPVRSPRYDQRGHHELRPALGSKLVAIY